MYNFLISQISSFDVYCNVTRLDNTFHSLRMQVPLLYQSALFH